MKTITNKLITSDIVVNVSGPVNIVENKDEIKLVSALKKITNKVNQTVYTQNNNFILEKGIYIPVLLQIILTQVDRLLLRQLQYYKITQNIFK